MKIKKETEILSLMETINLQSRGWIVVDHWDSDMCAIGFAKKNNKRRLVYVSCFGKDKGRFDYECEEPNGPDLDDYTSIEKGEDLSTQEIIDKLESYLR